MYWHYLQSLLQHKYWVFIAGLRVGVPIWRLLIHDWSKFLPSEFIPYSHNFFGKKRLDPVFDQVKLAEIKINFDRAWLYHQNRNSHHWQYWILVYDSDPQNMVAVNMPETYIREMVADWMGASKAYTKSWDMTDWLTKNLPRIKQHLHPNTIQKLNLVLHNIGYT